MSHSSFFLKVDRPVLLSNLISGAALLLLALPWSGPVLFLIGAVYVVAGSVFLGAVYAHAHLTVWQEALTWIAPWLVAVALWTGTVIGTEFENSASHYLFGFYVGLIIATPCFVVWQVVARAVREFMTWRSGEPLHLTHPSD